MKNQYKGPGITIPNFRRHKPETLEEKKKVREDIERETVLFQIDHGITVLAPERENPINPAGVSGGIYGNGRKHMPTVKEE